MTTLLPFPETLSLPHITFGAWTTALVGREWSSYNVGIRLPPSPSSDEQKPLWLKQVRETIKYHPLFKGKTLVQEFPDVEVLFDAVENSVIVRITPVIVSGKYTKLQRTIAQTRHYCFSCKGSGFLNHETCPTCHGEKILTKESVQELITPFFENYFSCGTILFHGAGREDVDVRMLGTGRPFALTIENPLVRKPDLSALEKEVNTALSGKVALSSLRVGPPSDVAYITRKYHTKRYEALVSSPEKIPISVLNPFMDQKIDVEQTTPFRVEKRRAMKTRPHWVVLEKVIPVDEKHVRIHLHASAGCYIKEFISGDEGRTHPSFSEWIGQPAHCDELDVLEIVEETAEFQFEVAE